MALSCFSLIVKLIWTIFQLMGGFFFYILWYIFILFLAQKIKYGLK